MKKKNLIWSILIILLGVVTLFLSSSGKKTISQKEPAVAGQRENKNNESNPDFKLPTVEGEKVVLSKQNSEFVLLNFWAIGCPYCIKQLKELRKINRKYSTTKLKIIGICMDNEPKKIKELVKKYKINYSMTLSKKGTPWKFGGIRGVPVTFLLNSERDIIEKYVGYVNMKTITSGLQ